jgi:hypothetical protein
MKKQKRPGIFISHNHRDKPFARRVADDLRRAGANVWIDEGEIRLGDSLIEKIKRGIDDMDYLGVVLSPDSVKSDWVLKEVKLAYEQEIEGKRVKVLPLLYRKCRHPKFLGDKRHADFSSEENYEEALGLVIDRLGLARSADAEDEPADADARLEKLSRVSPLLAAVLEEASAGVGPSNSTVRALVESPIPEPDVEKFWLLLAGKFEGGMRLHVARTALTLLDAAGVGGETIDFCLEGENLNAGERETLGMYMQDVTSEEAVLWCHRRMVSRVRSDTYYNSFLQKHAELILKERYDETAAYLLFPDRGPRSYNVDSLFYAAEHADAAEPFILRLKSWVNAGLFDGAGDEEGAESGALLYKKFNRAISAGQDKFDALIEENSKRVCRLLDSHDRDKLNRGLYHLVAMLESEFAGLDRVLPDVEREADVPYSCPEQRRLYDEVMRALRLLSRMNGGAGARPEKDLKSEFEEASRRVYLADNITGFWQPH